MTNFSFKSCQNHTGNHDNILCITVIFQEVKISTIQLEGVCKSAHNFLNIEDMPIKPMYKKVLNRSKDSINGPNDMLGPLCAKLRASV